MAVMKLGFGKGYVEVHIPEKNLMAVLEPNDVEIALTGEQEVRRGLAEPIGTPRLRDIVKKGEKIAVVTSDITRPMPSKIVLPPLLEEMQAAGVDLGDVTVVLALGSHRFHTEEEKRYLVGDGVFEKVRVIDGDPSNCVHLGVTAMGTPVDIVADVANADRVICLGNIEYHYFAGYSGGAKAIMPGVSTRDAIQSNHSRMVLPEAKAGALEGNPVREDIDSVADFLNIDFILNVVLDEKKTIIKAVAGHYMQAHRAGCAFLDSLYKVEIPRRADIVVVSPGGYPKDINMYQAQKALDNARHAVREGGIIVWLASAKEGLGEHVFEQWMTKSPSAHFMVEEIQRNFQLGGHKAAAIAMVLDKSRIFIVSDLEKDFLEKIFLEPFGSAQEAIDAAFAALGADASVIVMPYGGSTLPGVRE
jgi:nickel-dependent lactate racemase